MEYFVDTSCVLSSIEMYKPGACFHSILYPIIGAPYDSSGGSHERSICVGDVAVAISGDGTEGSVW